MDYKSHDRPIYLGEILWIVPIFGVLAISFLSPLDNWLPSIDNPNASRAVCFVKADSQIPGRAYVLLDKDEQCNDSSGMDNPYNHMLKNNPGTLAYMTADYGQTWRSVNDLDPRVWQLQDGEGTGQVAGIKINPDGVSYNNTLIWSFPRPIFHQFFDVPLSQQHFIVENISAPPGQGVLYVALGRDGLLVAPNPSEFTSRPTHLVQAELGLLPALIITDPLRIIIILIGIFTFPPLPWLHAWLVGQAYRYIFPIDETQKAMRLALIVSGVLTALAIPLVILWLSGTAIEYGTIVGVTTLSAVLLSVGIGVWEARRRQFTAVFVRKLALTTALLALVVPAGLVLPFLDKQGIGMIVGWWAILTAIVGFIRYRRALTQRTESLQARASLWQIDRLALEIPIGVTLLSLPIVSLVAWLAANNINSFYGWDRLGPACLAALAAPFVAVGIPTLCSLALVSYTRWRGDKMVLKKHDALTLHETPIFGAPGWRGTLLWETVLWIGSAIALAVVLVVVLLAGFY